MLTHTDTGKRRLAGDGQRELLFFFFFDGDGLEILSFEDLTAIQAFHVIHAVAPCDDLRAVVLASGLHKAIWDLF